MAGIYLHIPFCKTRCIYCDFYSTTRSDLKSRYIQALCRELEMRKEYLKGEPIRTVYFGGGTPSQLEEQDFLAVFDTLNTVYGLEQAEEITLEANPDDITPAYCNLLSRLPFNRVSMGIQTFNESTLRLLNRRHTAQQAKEAVRLLREADFHNLSIDLIYGLPGETDEQWLSDLQQAVVLGVEHISAYHLTYEEGTRLHQLLQAEEIHEVDEESSRRFFTQLTDTLQQAGYEQYEISNFCRPGFHSRHNTSYWQGTPYLGCGPSAHSFNGAEREWNVASLTRYLHALEQNKRLFECEQLTPDTRYNEYIMTALRTRRGLSLSHLRHTFGSEKEAYCLKTAAPYLRNRLLETDGEQLCLTREGIFISDAIICDLMWVE
ncbi:MAG: radical SAM family heme chaperone HemW [Bacteroides sp.]|nr:radical SAM family heme chaperone HemW [Bacteroides sp.]